jgi:hypothetical protein
VGRRAENVVKRAIGDQEGGNVEDLKISGQGQVSKRHKLIERELWNTNSH